MLIAHWIEPSHGIDREMNDRVLWAVGVSPSLQDMVVKSGVRVLTVVDIYLFIRRWWW